MQRDYYCALISSLSNFPLSGEFCGTREWSGTHNAVDLCKPRVLSRTSTTPPLHLSSTSTTIVDYENLSTVVGSIRPRHCLVAPYAMTMSYSPSPTPTSTLLLLSASTFPSAASRTPGCLLGACVARSLSVAETGRSCLIVNRSTWLELVRRDSACLVRHWTLQARWTHRTSSRLRLGVFKTLCHQKLVYKAPMKRLRH